MKKIGIIFSLICTHLVIADNLPLPPELPIKDRPTGQQASSLQDAEEAARIQASLAAIRPRLELLIPEVVASWSPDVSIPRASLIAELRVDAIPGHYSTMEESELRFAASQALDTLVNRKMMTILARHHGLVPISRSRAQAELDSLRTDLSQEDFDRLLSMAGGTEDSLIAHLQERVLADHLTERLTRDITIADDDIQQAWIKFQRLFPDGLTERNRETIRNRLVSRKAGEALQQQLDQPKRQLQVKRFLN